MTRTKMMSVSEEYAADFQRDFLNESLPHFRTQEALARFLMVTQQAVSKYKDGSNPLAIAKIIRIARERGLSSVTIPISTNRVMID